MTTGSCLCGGIQFEISGDLAPIQVCHCSQCRKAQGGPVATNIPVDVAALKIIQGSELIKEFESTPGKVRAFCTECGSPLFSKRSSKPGVVRIRAGSLDGDLATAPVFHFYVASKANWWPISDGLPQYPEAYAPPGG